MKEEWKKIKGFENYSISNLGNVKNKNNELMTPQVSPTGYYTILLYKNKKPYNKCMHRLVAENFINNPENKKIVNHKDLNKLNNNVNNLEWCTMKENSQHYHNNTRKIHKKAKKCCDNKGNIFSSFREAGKFYDISPNTVKNDCFGKTQKAKNFTRKITFRFL